MTTETVIETMVERIVARFQPARILLFGSRARGTANRWSDVDLLVVMEEGLTNAVPRSRWAACLATCASAKISS